MTTCIYCLEEKPLTAFNREHVIPQAFGTFEGNLVLDCVCKDCNDYFSRELELKLARDTVEGRERVRAGLVKPAAFKTLGRRGTTQAQFAADGPFRGAWATHVIDPSSGNVVLAPLPQVGFSVSPEGPFTWFLLDALPTKDAVGAKLGLKKGDHVVLRTEGVRTDDLPALLAKMGYGPTEDVANRPDVAGAVKAETIGVIADPEFRAVTKIAMNYLAAVAGANIARMPQFNDARRYARYAVTPAARTVTDVDLNRWSVTNDKTGAPAVGHYLSLETVRQLVVAQVSLMLAFRYIVVLARGDFLIPFTLGCSHLFEVNTRKVLAGPPLPLRRS